MRGCSTAFMGVVVVAVVALLVMWPVRAYVGEGENFWVACGPPVPALIRAPATFRGTVQLETSGVLAIEELPQRRAFELCQGSASRRLAWAVPAAIGLLVAPVVLRRRYGSEGDAHAFESAGRTSA